jgi:hypothetical protein
MRVPRTKESGKVERLLSDAPVPWSVSQSADGLHALVDANEKMVARSPMFGWLEAIAEIVNGKDRPE